MKTPDIQASYHDLSSLQQLRAAAKQDETAAIKQAAQQFESVFMGMLLSSMRKANAAFEEDNPLNSNATEFFRDMHDSQMSAELSKQGALGLADLMVQQLAPQHSATKAAAQISPPSRFDQVEVKTLKLPQQQKMLALPQQPAKVMQLDPERIVLPVRAAVVSDQQPSVQGPLRVTELAAAEQRFANQRNELIAKQHNIQQLAPEQVVAPISISTKTPQQPPLQWIKKPEPMTTATEQATAATAATLDPSSPAAFIQSLLPAAKKAAASLGLEPMALVAQAALETGWGQRMFKTEQGQNSHNLFGIKASPQWQGKVAVVDTLEYRQGIAQQEKAKFRVYEDPEQSLQDYVSFIQSNPRYQAALSVAGDTKAYFQRLQAAGYATDPNYAQKILAVLDGPAFKQVRNLLGPYQ